MLLQSFNTLCSPNGYIWRSRKYRAGCKYTRCYFKNPDNSSFGHINDLYCIINLILKSFETFQKRIFTCHATILHLPLSFTSCFCNWYIYKGSKSQSILFTYCNFKSLLVFLFVLMDVFRSCVYVCFTHFYKF